MPQLVVKVYPDGGLQTLLKDKVFDTSKFGARDIKRITLIEFDKGSQKFYIVWLRGPHRGDFHTDSIHCQIFEKSHDPRMASVDALLFDTYEDAVDHEIKCVNALRLKGVSFA